MSRRVGFGVTVAAWWLILLMVFAEVPWRAPLNPVQTLDFEGASFQEQFGQARAQDDTLRVLAGGADFSTLQTVETAALDAAQWRVLRYRYHGLSPNLELTFVFRTAAQPDDVQTVSLPWPIDDSASFDLSRVPQWQGRITESLGDRDWVEACAAAGASLAERQRADGGNAGWSRNR